MLAHGCSQHVASTSEVASSALLVVAIVAISVERTTAVVTRSVGAEEVLGLSLVARESLPAADLASRVRGGRVVEGVVVVDRSSHVQRMVPPAGARGSSLVVVGTLLLELGSSSERAAATSCASRNLALLLVPVLELRLDFDLFRLLDILLSLRLVAAAILTTLVTFGLRSWLRLLWGARLGAVFTRLLAIRDLASVPPRLSVLRFRLRVSLALFRSFIRLRLWRVFGLLRLGSFLADRLGGSRSRFFLLVLGSILGSILGSNL